MRESGIRRTGAAMVVEYAVRQGGRFAAGIPGHGSWAISDELLNHSNAIRGIQVMHEQSAVHVADGHYRATGHPMMAFTSIGPGAVNTAVGVATAFAGLATHARPFGVAGVRSNARGGLSASAGARGQGMVAAKPTRRDSLRSPSRLESDGERSTRTGLDRPGARPADGRRGGEPPRTGHAGGPVPSATKRG